MNAPVEEIMSLTTLLMYFCASALGKLMTCDAQLSKPSSESLACNAALAFSVVFCSPTIFAIQMVFVSSPTMSMETPWSCWMPFSTLTPDSPRRLSGPMAESGMSRSSVTLQFVSMCAATFCMAASVSPPVIWMYGLPVSPRRKFCLVMMAPVAASMSPTARSSNLRACCGSSSRLHGTAPAAATRRLPSSTSSGGATMTTPESVASQKTSSFFRKSKKRLTTPEPTAPPLPLPFPLGSISLRLSSANSTLATIRLPAQSSICFLACSAFPPAMPILQFSSPIGKRNWNSQSIDSCIWRATWPFPAPFNALPL
mmetsp:Transcript_2520/g.5826  ORF Transcript_2520/g.5826 Transcript_2520/m.5826 type:complete len:313 (+) Transcript_2520:473-1411(+)